MSCDSAHQGSSGCGCTAQGEGRPADREESPGHHQEYEAAQHSLSSGGHTVNTRAGWLLLQAPRCPQAHTLQSQPRTRRDPLWSLQMNLAQVRPSCGPSSKAAIPIKRGTWRWPELCENEGRDLQAQDASKLQKLGEDQSSRLLRPQRTARRHLASESQLTTTGQ